MTKIIILLVVAAVTVASINADANFPFPGFGVFNPFNNFGHGFPQQVFPPMGLLDPKNIKDMKPGPGETVSGAFVSSSSSVETVDGVTKKKSSGRVVTNNDGKVNDVSF